jgi:hypothetical protein
MRTSGRAEGAEKILRTVGERLADRRPDAVMPAALRYTRMGPPTLAASAARSERAGASELLIHCANAMLDAVVGDRSGICQKRREFRCGFGPGPNR